MRRRTSDLSTRSAGVLLVAGEILIWAGTVVNHPVTAQRTGPKIVFPPTAPRSRHGLGARRRCRGAAGPAARCAKGQDFTGRPGLRPAI